MRRSSKIFGIIPLLVAIMVLMSFTIVGVVSSPQTVSWSDDFSDGNLDGWTIQNGNFSVVNGTLLAAGGIIFDYYDPLNQISHPSSIAYGTWSFDVKVNTTSIATVEVFDVYLAIEEWRTKEDQDGYILTISPDPSGGAFGIKTPGFYLRYESLEISEIILGEYAGLEVYPNGLPDVFHVDVTRNMDGHFNLFVDGTLKLEAMDNTQTSSNVFGFRASDGYAFDNISIDDSIVIWPDPSDRAELICIEEMLSMTCEHGSTASTSFTIQNKGHATGYTKLVVTPTVSGFTPFIVGGRDTFSLMKNTTKSVEMGIQTAASVDPGEYEFTVEFWNSSTILDTLQLNLTVTEKMTQTTTTTTTESSTSFLFIGVIFVFMTVVVHRKLKKP